MNFSNISEIITQQIFIYIIFIKILKARVNKLSFYCPLLTFFFIIFLEYTQYPSVLFFLAEVILFFILPLLIISNMRKLDTLYTSLFVTGIYSFTNLAVSFVSTYVEFLSINNHILHVSTNCILVILLFFLSYNDAFLQSINGIYSTTTGIKSILVIFIWELSILITILTILLRNFSDKPIISFACLLIFTIMIVSCFVLYLLIINNLKSTYYKQLNTTIQNNMNEQVRYYEKLSVANENLRKFCHDFNNLKIGLNTYLKANDTVGALNYLNDCDMLIETGNEILHTGHHIVDALFSDKMQLTKENNISIKFEGLIPTDILTPVDLCIIFGNTLDNAIEACFKIENNTEKVINVTVKQNHDYIFVTFTNPCVENVEIKNNTILTTKQNTEMHGIGLYSIKQVLKSYDGHLTLHCENNIFTTEIDFCISTK